MTRTGGSVQEKPACLQEGKEGDGLRGQAQEIDGSVRLAPDFCVPACTLF